MLGDLAYKRGSLEDGGGMLAYSINTGDLIYAGNYVIITIKTEPSITGKHGACDIGHEVIIPDPFGGNDGRNGFYSVILVHPFGDKIFRLNYSWYPSCGDVWELPDLSCTITVRQPCNQKEYTVNAPLIHTGVPNALHSAKGYTKVTIKIAENEELTGLEAEKILYSESE